MAHDKAHYHAQGRSLHAAGLVIFFGAPRGWQHRAKQDGYRAAQAEWRAAHPLADEWAAARARARTLCEAMFKGPTP